MTRCPCIGTVFSTGRVGFDTFTAPCSLSQVTRRVLHVTRSSIQLQCCQHEYSWNVSFLLNFSKCSSSHLPLVARCSSRILPLQPETQHCRFSCGLGTRGLQMLHEAEYELHFASLTCLRCICRYPVKHPLGATTSFSLHKARTTDRMLQERLAVAGQLFASISPLQTPLHQRKRFRD